MNKNIAIQVKNVSKTFRIPREKITSLRGAATSLFKDHSYEEFKALDGIDFEVKKGEFFGIIGRNGSGKSTLLKILAGIYTPDKGSIKVNGLISPFLELGIGFNMELSGRDNVFLNATVLGLSHKEIEQKFDAIVQFSELERFIDQKLKNYSSGMQVRLAFAVSIFANREILLMDEVLAVGDSNFQSKCFEEFRKYKAMGRTVVLVTHDIDVVRRYCDRAMLLRQGKIVSLGDVNKVTDQYIFDNMSDEEKRLLEEEKYRAKKEAEEKARKAREDKIKIANVEKEQIALEKKRVEEDKKAKEEEERNRIAKIVKVEFLDKDKKKKNVFSTGDDIYIKIFFQKNKDVELINIGVGLYGIGGEYVFGYNTQADNVILSKNSEHVVLVLHKVPLLKGSYFVKLVCFGEDEQKYFDFVNDAGNFKMFSHSKNKNYRGLVDIEHQWQ